MQESAVKCVIPTPDIILAVPSFQNTRRSHRKKELARFSISVLEILTFIPVFGAEKVSATKLAVVLALPALERVPSPGVSNLAVGLEATSSGL